MLRRGLKLDLAGAERSRAVIDRTFGEVGERVKDGRRYLCGERFTAADLTFASLAAPIVLPEQYADYLPDQELWPAEFARVARAYRATPAGKLALRLYEER
jgi:glutathione S-transferase